jgi:hypothetical protein
MTIMNCWKEEATRGTNTLDTMYNFGGIPADSSYPLGLSHEIEINSEEIQGQSYPTLSIGNRFNGKTTATFIPHNAKCLHWMLGKATDQTTYVRLSNYSAGTPKPAISVFQSTTYDKFEAKGLVAQQLDLHQKMGGALDAVESFIGMAHGVSAATPSTSDLASETDPFDTCSILKWGSTNLTMEEIGLSFAHKITPLPKSDGSYGSLIDTNSMIAAAVTVKLHGDLHTLYTDQEAGTARTFEYKVIKSLDNTQYIDLTSSCLIKALTPRYFFNVPNIAIVILQCGAVQADVNDIAKANYGL